MTVEDQLIRLSIVKPSIQAVIDGTADEGQWHDTLAVFNIVNALAGMPGVLKGQPHAFCLEVAAVLEEVSAHWHSGQPQPLNPTQEETLWALYDVFVWVLEDVPMRVFEKAERLIAHRIAKRDGVTNLARKALQH